MGVIQYTLRHLHDENFELEKEWLFVGKNDEKLLSCPFFHWWESGKLFPLVTLSVSKHYVRRCYFEVEN